MSPSHEHARYLDLLERHLDGDLAAAERDTLFDHLEFCDECRQTLEAEERLLQRLRTVPKLVAPSGLRTNIISQALREQHERRTPLISDKRFSGLLDNVAAENRWARNDELASNPGADESDPASQDLPVFAGVRQPRRSRLRQSWRQASPYVAYTFVAIAATAALYSGNFRGMPLAQEVQAGIRTVVTFVMRPTLVGHSQDSTIGPADNQDRSAAGSSGSEPQQAQHTRPGTLPAPDALAYANQLAEFFTTKISATRTVVNALARTADGTYPRPAELSGATIATIVLKPTDPATRLGFEQDQLGNLLAAATDAAPNPANSADQTNATAMRTADQFAYEGHRYRAYSVRLQREGIENVVQKLEKYRVSADDHVLQALSSQGRMHFSTTRGQIAFYSSASNELESALHDLGTSSATGNAGRIQIVVVE